MKVHGADCATVMVSCVLVGYSASSPSAGRHLKAYCVSVGGFGDRGIEGKILAANYARTNNVPYLGVCLGLQIAVIEFAR